MSIGSISSHSPDGATVSITTLVTGLSYVFSPGELLPRGHRRHSHTVAIMTIFALMFAEPSVRSEYNVNLTRPIALSEARCVVVTLAHSHTAHLGLTLCFHPRRKEQ